MLIKGKHIFITYTSLKTEEIHIYISKMNKKQANSKGAIKVTLYNGKTFSL